MKVILSCVVFWCRKPGGDIQHPCPSPKPSRLQDLHARLQALSPHTRPSTRGGVEDPILVIGGIRVHQGETGKGSTGNQCPSRRDMYNHQHADWDDKPERPDHC